MIASNWVDPPKRERKNRLNLNENDYFKQAMRREKTDRTTGPRLPKMPVLQDFQFYDVKRLTTLFEKEHAFEVFKHSQADKEKQLKQQVGTGGGDKRRFWRQPRL